MGHSSCAENPSAPKAALAARKDQEAALSVIFFIPLRKLSQALS